MMQIDLGNYNSLWTLIYVFLVNFFWHSAEKSNIGNVVSDSLSPLSYGMLPELPGQDKLDCRLNLPGRHRFPAGVPLQPRRLLRQPLEHVHHQVVHHRHCL
ncbi:oligopeptide ABC transporter [Striga asiatica]|uniref:Oligopeptide ABC transporter n=1 Tax=Striga asiatica TaxID=4170 RepID=A0A5A7RD60_STRAF|nr:oligopeptide ABC transporter [Striga asiatica]